MQMLVKSTYMHHLYERSWLLSHKRCYSPFPLLLRTNIDFICVSFRIVCIEFTGHNRQKLFLVVELSQFFVINDVTVPVPGTEQFGCRCECGFKFWDEQSTNMKYGANISADEMHRRHFLVHFSIFSIRRSHGNFIFIGSIELEIAMKVETITANFCWVCGLASAICVKRPDDRVYIVCTSRSRSRSR